MGCSYSTPSDSAAAPAATPLVAATATNTGGGSRATKGAAGTPSLHPNPLVGAFTLLSQSEQLLLPDTTTPATEACAAFHRDPVLEDAATPSSPPAFAADARRHRGATELGVRHGYRTQEPSPEERAARLKRLTDIAREVHGYTAAVDQYPAPPADSARVRYSQHVCAQWLSYDIVGCGGAV